MTLYNWDTELYDILNKYFKCNIFSKRNKFSRGTLKRCSLTDFNALIENADIYFAGIQIILNLGVTEIINFPGKNIGMFPHPYEDILHVRKYICTPNSGQMDYYYPFKKRTIMFL